MQMMWACTGFSEITPLCISEAANFGIDCWLISPAVMSVSPVGNRTDGLHLHTPQPTSGVMKLRWLGNISQNAANGILRCSGRRTAHTNAVESA